MTPTNSEPLNKSLERQIKRLAEWIRGDLRPEYIESELQILVSQALAQQREDIRKQLPEKRRDTSAEDLRAGTFIRGQDIEVYGYNQAIDQITKILEELG